MGNVSGCCKDDASVAKTADTHQAPPRPAVAVSAAHASRGPTTNQTATKQARPNQTFSAQPRQTGNGGSTSYNGGSTTYASTASSDYTPYMSYGGHHYGGGGYDGGIGGGSDAGGGGGCDGGGGGGGCDGGGGGCS
ncbi:unnamed protein product [Phytophthora lilii]|uniref:Unnamed protein product n=1 Tax=Phytophthora lilii TaxID=2077276 RepID=A0A9W6U4Y9_9STRA|nr:unnamed protein product [Phytophthora lilii]